MAASPTAAITLIAFIVLPHLPTLSMKSLDITGADRTASSRAGCQTVGGGGVCAPFGTWCQSTILPSWTRKIAVACCPGPSQGLAFRSPRRKTAVTTGPRTRRETIFPEQGSAAFHPTASACEWSRVTIPACTTSASRANRLAAASLSPASSALLQARTTLAGDALPLPPQPLSKATMHAAARRERTTRRL